MAHCISLDETIPKKSIDVATNNVTHIHYGNSQSQTNPSQVGCYQNATSQRVYGNTFGSTWGSGEYHDIVCTVDSTRMEEYTTITPADYYAMGNRCPVCGCSRVVTVYQCPYTAGTTVMSIGVMHMDKVGARRTLTINFDDQITNAGSVISYAWNTGATTQSITVNQRGTYYCDVTWRETQSQVNHTVRLTYTF